MSDTAVQPAAAVDQWLASFDEALTAGDAAAAADLFLEDSYWRDLVAFTWNLKTVEGRDGVEDMLQPRARGHEAAQLARRPSRRTRRTASSPRGSSSRPRPAAATGSCASGTARRGRC